jgi:diguanylate cyclase (GGDEF)-like protein
MGFFHPGLAGGGNPRPGGGSSGFIPDSPERHGDSLVDQGGRTRRGERSPVPVSGLGDPPGGIPGGGGAPPRGRADARARQPRVGARTALEHVRSRDLGSEGWLRQMLHLATLDELLRLVLVRVLQISHARHGAIWVHQEGAFFQRCGEGYPEAPIPLSEAASLVRSGDAWLLCPGAQMGLLRLRGAKGDPEHYLGWIREVEDLLVNAWNLEISQALSFKDDLTVAQNRRCLDVELPRYVREAAAHGEAVSLLFLDVDNLKALNSQFGHPTGSLVLATVAQVAKNIIRNQDRLYRYGGDEFCILIPGTAATGAAKLGERVIQQLQETQLFSEGNRIPISVSIGISAYPAHAHGAEHLIERADRALFQAKREGKGRVVVAG